MASSIRHDHVPRRRPQAFASNFEAASSRCLSRVVPTSRVSLPVVPAMSHAEVEDISALLSEVQRSCEAFGEVTEAPRKLRRASRCEVKGGTGADQRVEQKLSYFRDRQELVLPIIEDRYLTHDAKRDCLSK